MTARFMMVFAGSLVLLFAAIAGAQAAPCWGPFCQVHAAPAPLLAAGIPAFAAVGGGAVVHRLWRRFGRRS